MIPEMDDCYLKVKAAIVRRCLLADFHISFRRALLYARLLKIASYSIFDSAFMYNLAQKLFSGLQVGPDTGKIGKFE